MPNVRYGHEHETRKKTSMKRGSSAVKLVWCSSKNPISEIDPETSSLDQITPPFVEKHHTLETAMINTKNNPHFHKL